jgi:dihydrofolate reductase
MSRQVVYVMSVSLDGYMEGPNREIDWHHVDDELHRHFNEELAPAGAFLDGRVTYQLMADFWPTADEDPAASDVTKDFARIWRDMPKIVYSRTLERADWNTTIVREIDPDEVRELKAQAGGDLIVGGANVAAVFRAHDLIDEYRVYIHPVLIGRGKPMFQPYDGRAELRLAESHGFGNGVVLLRYVRA